ncbi:MAG TPA: cytochrome c3 family protein [Terriglobia bacterium]|nr:cytochrome c3 family protein [Terriglobia bacterium]
MKHFLPSIALIVLCLWAAGCNDQAYAGGGCPKGVAPISYRNTAPGVAYVGSKACAACHATIYQEYIHTDMAQSMSLPHQRSELENLQAPVTVFNAKLNQYFQIFRRGADFWESEYAVGEEGKELFRHTEKISYAMGTGENGIGYMVQRGNFIFEAPLAFYARAKSWELSPGFEANDFGFGRPVTDGCISCHAGFPQPVADPKGLFRTPPFRELGIGCENCHGPGQLHVEERMKGERLPGDLDSSIVNPARLSPWLALNICMYCHEQGDARVLNPGKNFADFRPGTPLAGTLGIFISLNHPPEEKQTFLGYYSEMKASKCFLMSRGELTCLTCHNPHHQLTDSNVSADYNSKCLTCHKDQSCRLPLPTRFRKEGSDNCVKCHMAKQPAKLFAHTVITEHRIGARPGEPYPESEFTPSSPDAPDLVCLSLVEGEGASIPLPVLLAAYRQLLTDRPDPASELNYSKLLDKAAKTDPDNVEVLRGLAKRGLKEGTPEGFEEALPYFQRMVALGLGTPDDEFALGELWAVTGEVDRGLSLLQKAAPLDPYNPLGYESLAISFWVAGKKDDAVKEIQQGLDVSPENQVLRFMLKKAEEGDMAP